MHPTYERLRQAGYTASEALAAIRSGSAPADDEPVDITHFWTERTTR